MPDRTTLYVIRIQDGQVQAVHGSGRPVSTPDGEHFALIEGPSLQVYATNDLFIGSRAKTFDSDIVYHRFLTNSYLAIATEKGDHTLIDLRLLFNSSSSFLTPLPGGAPLASVWIHPDVYTYVSRGNGRGGIRLHSYNTTSGKAVDEKELTAVPDLLLFLPRQVKIEPTPPVTDTGGSNRLSADEIAGVISAAVMVCIVALVVVGVGIAVPRVRVKIFGIQLRRATDEENLLLCVQLATEEDGKREEGAGPGDVKAAELRDEEGTEPDEKGAWPEDEKGAEPRDEGAEPNEKGAGPGGVRSDTVDDRIGGGGANEDGDSHNPDDTLLPYPIQEVHITPTTTPPPSPPNSLPSPPPSTPPPLHPPPLSPFPPIPSLLLISLQKHHP